MRINWKKTIIITLDTLLAVYLMLAFTAFRHPDLSQNLCTKVNIDIQDQATSGFISAKEIKQRLEQDKLYPLAQPIENVNLRHIEEALKNTPFVRNAQCYKTQGGEINISLTQRMPVLRIKADNGKDYYVDDNYSVMPNSHYISDLIIATGNITPWFATNFLAPIGKVIMDSEFWRDLIVQINVLPDHGIELVPRIGDNIVYLGQIPTARTKTKRQALATAFIQKKLDRLEKFYRYGLSVAGWNLYYYINLEFDNQIICKRRDHKPQEDNSLINALQESDVIGNVPTTTADNTPSAAKTPPKNEEEAQKSTPQKSNTADKNIAKTTKKEPTADKQTTDKKSQEVKTASKASKKQIDANSRKTSETASKNKKTTSKDDKQPTAKKSSNNKEVTKKSTKKESSLNIKSKEKSTKPKDKKA